MRRSGQSCRGRCTRSGAYLAVRRRLDEGMYLPPAIRAAAAGIRARATRFAGLNCLLLTPDALYAYAAHSPHPEVVRRRDADFFALDHRRHADSVVVASTGRPQAAPRWATLPEDHVLEIRRGDLSAVVHGG
ncbi:hypothetical protein QFZ63_007085 [Streptomyces sp. B3I7]|nr:hypothetical protein [Streptomyces sp. B3I7]